MGTALDRVRAREGERARARETHLSVSFCFTLVTARYFSHDEWSGIREYAFHCMQKTDVISLLSVASVQRAAHAATRLAVGEPCRCRYSQPRSSRLAFLLSLVLSIVTELVMPSLLRQSHKRNIGLKSTLKLSSPYVSRFAAFSTRIILFMYHVITHVPLPQSSYSCRICPRGSWKNVCIAGSGLRTFYLK